MYSSLDSNRRELRLLRLAPGAEDSPVEGSISITTVPSTSSVKSPPPVQGHEIYEALSYECGDPNGPKHTVTIDGKIIEVRDNLHKALKMLRRSGVKMPVWIDAICINQRDSEERGHQVRMMGDIYKSAKMVRIWLGWDRGENLRGGCRLIQKLATYRYEEVCEQFECENPLAHDTDKLEAKVIKNAEAVAPADEGGWEALVRVLQRSYRDGVWIVQECSFAPEIKICCGRASTCTRLLYKAFRAIFNEYFPSEEGPADISVSRVVKSSGYKIINSRRVHSPGSFTLLHLLEITIQSKCQDPHDKIYGTMGLAKETLGLPVSYDRSISQVKKDVVQAIVYYHYREEFCYPHLHGLLDMAFANFPAANQKRRPGEREASDKGKRVLDVNNFS